ncbi:MAG: NAD(P)H-binding protein [Pseudonocardiaceae bacterium]
MTQNTEQHRLTLVLGGSGKTGRRVAERLRPRGRPIRIGSRSGEVPFDWADQATWAAALHDVGSVYLAYSPDIGDPSAAPTIRSFADVAVKSGVRRLVLLSARGEEAALPAEQAVQEAGADWTIVRGSWFFQNFSEGILLEPVRSGVVAFPAGQLPQPFIDADDLADVVVAALTEDRHAGQIYELASSPLLTFAEAVGEIAKATGREIRYLPVSSEQYASMLAQYGFPAEVVAFLTELFAELLDGRNSHLTDGVQRCLGRDPRDFADYARDAATTGVWDV